MGLTLRIEGSGAVPGRVQSVAMTGEALTIGRAEGNDLVLPDPERVISSRHCVLEARGGDYLLIDISTNGTFLNYSPEPVGDVPAPLNHGDVITIGRYELRVEIAGARRPGPPGPGELPPPLEEAPIVAARPRPAAEETDFLAALDDPGRGGRDFLDDLLGEGPKLGPPGRRPAHEPEGLRAHELIPDDPLAPSGPEADPFGGRGGSDPYHSAAPQDHFRPPPVRAPLIPDDWDADLAPARPEPRPAPARPAPAHPGPPRRSPAAALIPEDADFGAEAQGPAPADPFAEPAGPPAAPAGGHPPAGSAAPAMTPRAAPARPEPRPEPRPDPRPGAPAGEPARPEPVPPRAAPAAPAPRADAARAFLAAAGVERLDIPDAELEAVMARLGETFRILVTGLREVLIARASIKNEFRLSQTVISIDGNNPIKFSISPEQAIEALVRTASPGYLPAPAAAREAVDDIKAHEVAMMSGMQAAIQGLLKRFDPERLAGRIETGGLSGLLGNRKARYWDAFEQLYGDIAREAEDDFQALFGKEFARAYQAQVKKL